MSLHSKVSYNVVVFIVQSPSVGLGSVPDGQVSTHFLENKSIYTPSEEQSVTHRSP